MTYAVTLKATIHLSSNLLPTMVVGNKLPESCLVFGGLKGSLSYRMYCITMLLPLHTAGTQTMLTFPITFDLEKLVMAAYHGKATPTECLEEGEGRDVGNCSLRRKLFGQPERQVCVCV